MSVCRISFIYVGAADSAHPLARIERVVRNYVVNYSVKLRRRVVQLLFFTHSDGRARFSPPDDRSLTDRWRHLETWFLPLLLYSRLLLLLLFSFALEYDVDGIFINDGPCQETPQCSNTRIKKKYTMHIYI